MCRIFVVWYRSLAHEVLGGCAVGTVSSMSTLLENPESFTLPRPDGKLNIALVAHDARKSDLLDWAEFNFPVLQSHHLIATGTTGSLLAERLDLPVEALLSGPLGGDQQIGARAAEGDIDLIVFFWDPLATQPHDTDVKALLRISAVWNVPIACNRATADYLISSPLLSNDYEPAVPHFEAHNDRMLP